MNIVSNFSPQETVIYDGRNPPWRKTQIKSLINKKAVPYKQYFRSGENTKIFEKFKLLQGRIVNLTIDSRDLVDIVPNKLNDS